MASRREQKVEARAARLAAAEAEAAAALRRRRLWSFAGIVAVAVIALVVVIAVSGGGGSSGESGLQSTRQAAGTYRQVERELAGIPQHGLRLGDASARVTMTYIGDLECPYCRAFTLSVLPQFIDRYVRSGKVKVIYRSLCTATCHDNAQRFVPQQVAAYAAGRQGLFWQYAEMFYREQEDETLPYVTEHFLRGIARQIPGLNLGRWLRDRKDPALASQVEAGQVFTRRQRLPGQTPEVLMSGPHGTAYLPAEAAPTLTWLINTVGKVS